MAAVIDAHQHFWSLEAEAYRWIRPEMGVLYRDYAPADLEPELRALDVDRTIIVQAANEYEDTELMLRAAKENPWVAGVVGWVPLEDPGEVRRALRRFTADRSFRGVRHLVQVEPDPDWLVRPAVLESLRMLADLGLVFEIPAEFPRHLGLVPVLTQAVPDLRIVIDHLAKPPIRERAIEPWASQLADAARHPNVHAKLSGLNTAADHEQWTAADLAPFVEVAFRCFGADRLMVGSDWPVCLLAGDYTKVWTGMREAMGRRSPEEIDAVYGGTATRVYALRDRLGEEKT